MEPEHDPDPWTELSRRFEALADEGPAARDALLELLYAELRRQAAGLLARESAAHTLQPTALVHEAWLRIEGQAKQSYDSRRQFLALASTAMRRVLVDHARRRDAAKRGGSWERVTLGAVGSDDPTDERDLLALEEALAELERESPRRARTVELIWFGGCTAEEAAAVLDVSARTVGADWRYARAWLYDRIEGGQS